MNALVDRNWREDIALEPVAELAEALGYEWTGRGDGRVFRVPHGRCPGEHSDGRPTVFIGDKNRLVCRKCNQHMNGVDLVALSLGMEPARSRPPEDWQRIRAAASSQRWCTEDPRGSATNAQAVAVWEQERAEREARRVAEHAAKEQHRQAHALDVATAWRALTQARFGLDVVEAWARARRVPEGLIPHLPHQDLAGVPTEEPTHTPAGVTAAAWCLARRLLGFGHEVARRVLIALRDRYARPLSVSRRWHQAGAPADGKAKAMQLPGPVPMAGSPTTWAGGLALFGDLEVAVTKARAGHPIVIAEGGPDYAVGSAACRAARHGSFLAVPGAQQMPKLGDLLASEIRRRFPPTHLPEVLIIPDTGDAGNAGAWGAEAALTFCANVTTRRPPVGDLSDFAATTDALGVINFLFRGN